MLTVSDNHIVLGGGGGGGSTTFVGLSDKATADIPAINTPLATALDTKEATSNKKTDVDANKTSNTFFPTIKAVFDWVSGLFVKGAASSTNNAIARFDGVTGKLVRNSAVTISDVGVINSNAVNITSVTEKLSCYESGVPANDGYFKVTNATLSEGVFIPAFALKGNGNTALYANGFVIDARYDTAGGGAVCDFMARANGPAVVNRPLFVFSNYNTIPSGACLTIYANKSVRFHGQIVDNVGSSGTDGQVLKKVGGLVIWANP